MSNLLDAEMLSRLPPVLFLLVLVGTVQLQHNFVGWPLVIIAALVGCIIVGVAGGRRLVAWLLTLATAVLLLSFSYVHSLQVEEVEALRHHQPTPGQNEVEMRFLRAVVSIEDNVERGLEKGLEKGLEAMHKVTLPKTSTTTPEVAASSRSTVQLETFSVVLPCSFEGNFAIKTVESVLKHTDNRRLLEVIVVDDGSQPPLRTIFPTHLVETRAGQPEVRILRHEQTLGLIAAKQTGGDAARGDVIVFFDCHILPRDGWEEAFLRQMKRMGDHRTVVVPTITSLDADTWEEIVGGPVSKACFVLLNGDFTWLLNSGRDVPLMSGGLLAMSRQWWQETEGYDKHMVAWGGENIDQSVRTWLCGGRIEAAEGAYVAHMWRDPKKPNTRLKYPIPTADVMRNKARAVKAWFGPFADKVLTFPEYDGFVDGSQEIGDMSNFDQVREKLHCKPFSAYLARFSYVYFETGLVPERIFQLREVSTGLCLERLGLNGDQPHQTALLPCAGPVRTDSPYPGSVKEMQLWHPANRNNHLAERPCCSGFMQWNFMQCLDAQAPGGLVRTFECSLDGHAPNQLFALSEDGQMMFRPPELSADNTPHTHGKKSQNHIQGGCISPMQPLLGSAQFQQMAQCTTEVKAVEGDPNSFYLRHRNIVTGVDMCATATASQLEENGPGWVLQFAACDHNDPQQVLHKKHESSGGFFVNVGESEMCLDSASGSKILVYPCYDQIVNMNQMWHIQDQKLAWGQDSCLDAMPAPPPKTQDGRRFSLQTCSDKQGQRIRRHEHEDVGTFLLLDADTELCLDAVGSNLELVNCSAAARWQQTPSQQVQWLGERRICLDASVEDHIRVTPCRHFQHQFFEVSDRGWINTKIHWDDNGRKRWHERCLDYNPTDAVKVIIEDCSTASRRSVRWEMYSVSVPIERASWQSMEKPADGEPFLGSEPDIPK